jgi:hypothetical protein
MIINQELPLGLIANTAAVLGLSLGERVPDLIGPEGKINKLTGNLRLLR